MVDNWDTSAHRSATMVNLKTVQPTHWYSLQELHMWQSHEEIWKKMAEQRHRSKCYSREHTADLYCIPLSV